jgi:hypothetical protein
VGQAGWPCGAIALPRISIMLLASDLQSCRAPAGMGVLMYNVEELLIGLAGKLAPVRHAIALWGCRCRCKVVSYLDMPAAMSC